MTLNIMLYDHVNEEIRTMSINDFCDNDDPLKVIEEHPVCEVNIEVQDPCYIRWQMFDEIPERVYNIECEGYIDKNGKPLTNGTSIKYLTNGEPKLRVDNDIEICDENSKVIDYMDYEDHYYCMDYNKYDLRKITKQIRTTKFICEAPIDCYS